MNKIDTIQKLKEEKLVAVIRGSGYEEVRQLVDAIYKGGIHLMEITFTIPHAEQVIGRIKEDNKDKTDMAVGAGTVLDIVSARLAILAGADFIVCPHFDKEISKLCNLYQVPCFPGAVTVSEITEALRYGRTSSNCFLTSCMVPRRSRRSTVRCRRPSSCRQEA